jgi:hypothetical protein
MPHPLVFDERHSYREDFTQAIVVPVGLYANGIYVDVAAKLDTGAEYCLFDRKWADWLDIDVESGPRRTFRGLAGRLDAFEHEVTMRCFETAFTSVVYFTGDVGVARDLLGRNGWLDRLRVAIVHYDREIYLSPYD